MTTEAESGGSGHSQGHLGPPGRWRAARSGSSLWNLLWMENGFAVDTLISCITGLQDCDGDEFLLC